MQLQLVVTSELDDPGLCDVVTCGGVHGRDVLCLDVDSDLTLLPICHCALIILVFLLGFCQITIGEAAFLCQEEDLHVGRDV